MIFLSLSKLYVGQLESATALHSWVFATTAAVVAAAAKEIVTARAAFTPPQLLAIAAAVAGCDCITAHFKMFAIAGVAIAY